MESPDKEKSLKAYQKEYDAQIPNKTWELVPIPPGRVALNCKIIGKLNPSYEGVEEIYKGRLVVIGSRQKYGLDYEETFSPVLLETRNLVGFFFIMWQLCPLTPS